MGRKLRTFTVFVVGVLAAGFLMVHHLRASSLESLARATTETATAPPRVDVARAENAPPFFPLRLPGETAAWDKSVIYARVDGYVAHWDADIGDRVRKGQVLATIDTPDLDAQLASAQAKLKASRAQAAVRQAETDFAKTTYERWNDSPKGVVSEQEREAKKADYASAKARLNAAQAQVGLDWAQVDRYLALTEFKKVTAPYDGTIIERRIDVGNLVTAGSTSNTTSLYSMVRDNPLRVFVDVPQSAAGDMKAGLSVEIRAADIPGRVFEGAVTRTAKSISKETRTLRVEVDIPNSDKALVSGMYVEVGFQVPTAGLVQVPDAALIFRPEGPRVAVVGKDNKIAFHEVAIARDGGDSIEIGSGVAAGDRVALNISNQIADGETVEAHESTEDPPNAQARN
jgi:RND family efflux transporter MFP subunit